MTDAGHNRTKPDILAPLERWVQSARGAVSRRRKARAACIAASWSAPVAALAVIGGRLAGLSVSQAWWLLLIVPAGALAGVLIARASAGDAYRIAKRIDDELGLKDRLAGGYDLLRRARSPEGLEDTPFTRLAVADALEAVEQAKGSYRVPIRVPRGLAPAAACLLIAVAASLWIIPAGGPAEIAVTAEQRRQARALNELAAAIRAMDVSEEQQQAMLDALLEIQISEDELKKMSRADIIRRLREANAKIRVPEGAGGAALKRAVEDQLRAIAEMEQIQQQLAEIEAINRREAVIDLGDGRTAAAGNIHLESSDLRIDEEIAAAAARPGEGEQEYRRRLAEAEARAAAEREKIKRFLATQAPKDMPEADLQKLSHLLETDAEFQGRVMEAIKDPNSTQFDAMREIYRRQLEREFEKENIPRGLRQQLTTYLGK